MGPQADVYHSMIARGLQHAIARVPLANRLERAYLARNPLLPGRQALPARTLDSGEAGRVHTVQGMHGWRVACKERACLEQAVEGPLALV